MLGGAAVILFRVGGYAALTTAIVLNARLAQAMGSNAWDSTSYLMCNTKISTYLYVFISFLAVYGGEGEIRTLERLPVTHFPGVRLRPLGHLTVKGAHHTIRFCCCQCLSNPDGNLVNQIPTTGDSAAIVVWPLLRCYEMD